MPTIRRLLIPTLALVVIGVLGPGQVTGAVAGGPPGGGPELFPNSFFDHSVANQPVAANSSTLVANMVRQYKTHYGSIGVNRMPIFTVPAAQPTVSISVESGCYSFLPNTGTEIPIPSGAYNSRTSDDFMIVTRTATGDDWELWRATDASGRWSACWGGRLNQVSSTGVYPAPFGMSASGISYLATTITEADVASGQIHHAIAMQVVDCNGSVAPADRTDCGSSTGAPSEGTWFRLPAGTPMPAGLTPLARMVFSALQTYGAVVVDHAGAVMIEAENSRDWAFEGNAGIDPITLAFAGEPQYEVLDGIPWGQLQVIDPPA